MTYDSSAWTQSSVRPPAQLENCRCTLRVRQPSAEERGPTKVFFWGFLRWFRQRIDDVTAGVGRNWLSRMRGGQESSHSPWAPSSAGSGSGAASPLAGGLRFVDLREEEWMSSGSSLAWVLTGPLLRGGYTKKYNRWFLN